MTSEFNSLAESNPQSFSVPRGGQASRIPSYARGISYANIGPLTAVVDLLIIVLASLLGGLIYQYSILHSATPLLVVGANAGVLFVLVTKSKGCYSAISLLSARKQIHSVILNWILVLMVATAALFLLKTGSSYSRGSTLIKIGRAHV